MHPYENLFNQFALMAQRFRNLASIVQNPVEVRPEDLSAWQVEFDAWLNDAYALRTKVATAVESEKFEHDRRTVEVPNPEGICPRCFYDPDAPVDTAHAVGCHKLGTEKPRPR